MATANVSRRSDVDRLAAVLDLPAVRGLISELQETRWTGRPGYPIRSMVGLMLTKSIFALPTWTRTIRLVAEHEGLREVLDCLHDDDMPSVDAVYRFTKKLILRRRALEDALAQVLVGLHEAHPRMGRGIAIDASDMPAYANGQRYVSKNGRERAPEEFSDPDASWGHRSAVSTRRGGGFYGYRLHAAVCCDTELPVAWEIASARPHESTFVSPLLDKATGHGFVMETVAMDKGYDAIRVYDECETRGIRPVIALRETAGVRAGRHKPPECEHGTWVFKGAEIDRKATKWACPAGQCKPGSVRIKADRLHPLIPRETERFKQLYAKRGAVEREFGRLKHEHGLLPLRVRGLDRVKLHADLTILTQLGCALAQARSAGRFGNSLDVAAA